MANLSAITGVHATLVGSTVDTVTLSGRDNTFVSSQPRVTVDNTTASTVAGAAAIYVKASATIAPAVGAVDTFVVLPGQRRTIPFNGVVKLISSGTPTYSVNLVDEKNAVSPELERERNSRVAYLANVANVAGNVVNRVLYNYGTTSYPARPSGVTAGLVEYVGPVAPSDALDMDTWVDNS